MSSDLNLRVEFWPKQYQAFITPATELLYGGATRGGKSVFTRLSLSVWSSLIPGLQCFIFRKFYDDVVQNHMEGPLGFRSLLAGWARAGICTTTMDKVRFRNGSLISLEHCSTDEAMEKAQGVPKNVLVVEEATQIPEKHIKFLRGWVTMPEDMKDKLPEQIGGIYPGKSAEELREMFPRIIYTANAIGESMSFFRREFVKAQPKGTIWVEGAFKRQYIEALVGDNPSENADAVKGRILSIGDEAMADALLNANWDAPVGDFFPQYSDSKHCVPDFMPPEHWLKFRTFDWGSSEPFSVLWWCVSDGKPFEYEGDSRWFPRGSLICYREWYGCQPKNHAKGLEMRNEDIARGILARTPETTSDLTLTDSLPFQDRGMTKHGRKYLISDVFRENGVPLRLANTARVFGWKQVKDRLIGQDGLPLIYFCQRCVHVRDYLPALPRHESKEEDAAESGEATHMADCVRYACATKTLVKDSEETTEVDYRDINRRSTVQTIIDKLNAPQGPAYVTRR